MPKHSVDERSLTVSIAYFASPGPYPAKAGDGQADEAKLR